MTIGSTVLSALVADAGMDVRSLAVSLFLFAGALTSTGALLWAHQDAKGSLLVSQPGEVSIATTKDGETVACVDGRTFAASAIERLELHHVRSGIGIVFLAVGIVARETVVELMFVRRELPVEILTELRKRLGLDESPVRIRPVFRAYMLAPLLTVLVMGTGVFATGLWLLVGAGRTAFGAGAAMCICAGLGYALGRALLKRMVRAYVRTEYQLPDVR